MPGQPTGAPLTNAPFAALSATWVHSQFAWIASACGDTSRRPAPFRLAQIASWSSNGTRARPARTPQACRQSPCCPAGPTPSCRCGRCCFGLPPWATKAGEGMRCWLEVLPATRHGQRIAGVPIDVHAVGRKCHLRQTLFIGRLALARGAPGCAIVSPEGS